MSKTVSKDEQLQELGRKIAVIKHLLYKKDRIAWLSEAVKTHDEHDPESAVKPFPIKPYIPPLVKLFETEKILLVPKSRQVMASWLFSALCLHTAQFFDYRRVLVISKKEQDAYALVDRIKFMYNHQPMWLKNLCPLDRQMRDQPMGHLTYKNGSHIIGMPQGPDQVRSYTSSLIFADEAAFQDQFELTYGACTPSILGGGKIVAVSSANASYFQTLCEY